MPDKMPAKRGFGARKFALMLAITVVCGVVIALIGGWLFAEVITVDDVGFARLGNFLLGMVAGYALGLIFGVWLAARLLHRPGRSWQSAFGAVIGVALVMLLSEPLSLSNNQALLLAVLVVVPALFAVIGHGLRFSRRR